MDLHWRLLDEVVLGFACEDDRLNEGPVSVRDRSSNTVQF